MGRAFKRLGANVKGVEIEDIKELKQKFLDEQPKWDGKQFLLWIHTLLKMKTFQLIKQILV